LNRIKHFIIKSKAIDIRADLNGGQLQNEQYRGIVVHIRRDNAMIMNNQSKKPEKLEPQDSEQKNIKHPRNDDKAVVKPEDKVYKKDNPHFADPAKRREQNEQPVNPIKEAPKE
jgi:hypothetical protein